MKHFITLASLALAPFAAFAQTEAGHTNDHKAPVASKPVDPVCKDGCCDADAKATAKPDAKPDTHEHNHDHDDIKIAPTLVAKFGIVSEKIAPGKIARTTLLTGTTVKEASIIKQPGLVVEAKVSERVAAKLKAGENYLRVAATGGQTEVARFISVTSGKALFTLENKTGAIEAGAPAEFRLVTSEKEHALTVSRTAIQGAKNKTFVYVEESPGVYEKHPVIVVDSDELRIAITGADAGETVVTKSAAVQNALDSSHGHTHGPNGEEPEHDHAAHDHSAHDHAKPAQAPVK